MFSRLVIFKLHHCTLNLFSESTLIKPVITLLIALIFTTYCLSLYSNLFVFLLGFLFCICFCFVLPFANNFSFSVFCQSLSIRHSLIWRYHWWCQIQILKKRGVLISSNFRCQPYLYYSITIYVSAWEAQQCMQWWWWHCTSNLSNKKELWLHRRSSWANKYSAPPLRIKKRIRNE